MTTKRKLKAVIFSHETVAPTFNRQRGAHTKSEDLNSVMDVILAIATPVSVLPAQNR